MRRRQLPLVLGTLVVLCVSLAPAHASLFDSMRNAVTKVHRALPVRISVGPKASLTRAQRDSVRRVRLARLATLSARNPPAWSEDFVYLSRGLEVRFRVADSVSRSVDVFRRSSTGAWIALGRVRVDPTGRGSWRDLTVRSGGLVQYALKLRSRSATPLVTLPAIDYGFVPALKVEALMSTAGPAQLRLRLPNGYPATLELFDVSGRRLGEIDVRGLRAGEHLVHVPEAMLPARGVYFVRLQQHGDEARDKLIVVK